MKTATFWALLIVCTANFAHAQNIVGDWQGTLKAGPMELPGNRDFEVDELPGLNHLFQTANTGTTSEYAEIAETISPLALGKIAGWVSKRWSDSHPQDAYQSAQARYANAHSYIDDPLQQLLKNIPELRGIRLAADQAALPQILKKTGNNVDAYLSNLVDLIAREQITLDRSSGGELPDILNVFTGPMHLEDNYLIVKEQGQSGYEMVEYRMDAAGHRLDDIGANTGFAATRGFALMCQFFSTALQRESVFRFLGEQRIDSRDTYVVGFAQKPGSATMLVGVRTEKGRNLPVMIQGIAWVDKRDFQIIRIRTDLLAPRPDLALDYQTTEIIFSPVRLVDAPVPLWLPKAVNVNARVEVHSPVHGITFITFRNEHRYSDYRLYRVSVRMVPAQ